MSEQGYCVWIDFKGTIDPSSPYAPMLTHMVARSVDGTVKIIASGRPKPGQTVQEWHESFSKECKKEFRKHMNTMKAIGRNIIIQPDEVPKEEVTDGGIVLAKSDEPKLSDLRELKVGTITSIGSGGEDEDGEYAKPDPRLQVGTRVMYRPLDVKGLSDSDLLAIDCEDVIAVVTEDQEEVG